MKTNAMGMGTLIALALGFSITPAARADDHEVEVEHLSAKVSPVAEGWRLRASYDVETEDFPRARFDLVLRLTHDGNVLVDAASQPIDFVIPLDLPTDVDDEELEYEGKIDEIVALPETWDTDDVRIEALVMDRLNNAVVAAKHERIASTVERVRTTQVVVSTGYVNPTYVSPTYVSRTYVSPIYVSPTYVRTVYVRPTCVGTPRIRAGYVHADYVRTGHRHSTHVRTRVVRRAPVRVTHVRRVTHRVPRRGFRASVSVVR